MKQNDNSKSGKVSKNRKKIVAALGIIITAIAALTEPVSRLLGKLSPNESPKVEQNVSINLYDSSKIQSAPVLGTEPKIPKNRHANFESAVVVENPIISQTQKEKLDLTSEGASKTVVLTIFLNSRDQNAEININNELASFNESSSVLIKKIDVIPGKVYTISIANCPPVRLKITKNTEITPCN